MAFDGARIAFLVVEWSDGYNDHNGDGDTDDWVLFTYDLATKATVNLALACGQYPALEQGLAIAVVRENAQGATDLNGDGDAVDLLAHLFDTRRGITWNLGHAGREPFVHAGLAAFLVLESQDGAVDLNGDGDAMDEVPFVATP